MSLAQDTRKGVSEFDSFAGWPVRRSPPALAEELEARRARGGLCRAVRAVADDLQVVPLDAEAVGGLDGAERARNAAAAHVAHLAAGEAAGVEVVVHAGVVAGRVVAVGELLREPAGDERLQRLVDGSEGDVRDLHADG